MIIFQWPLFYQGTTVYNQGVSAAVANTQGVDENAEANHALHLFRKMSAWAAYYSIVVEGLPGSVSGTGIILVYLPERTFTADLRERTLELALPERTLSVELREGGREKA